jgi:hypothetical protein
MCCDASHAPGIRIPVTQTIAWDAAHSKALLRMSTLAFVSWRNPEIGKLSAPASRIRPHLHKDRGCHGSVDLELLFPVERIAEIDLGDRGRCARPDRKLHASSRRTNNLPSPLFVFSVLGSYHQTMMNKACCRHSTLLRAEG